MSLASLCSSCSFMRPVEGRRGQVYLLCRNEAIPAKYLPQPVIACHGYAPVECAGGHGAHLASQPHEG